MIRLQVTHIYYSLLKSFETGWADFSNVDPFPQAGLVVDMPAVQEDAVAAIGLTETDRAGTSLFIFKSRFAFLGKED